MTKDIGIVLLPNQDCKSFALEISSQIEKQLPDSVKLSNTPHITLLHVANLDEVDQALLQRSFAKFIKDNNNQDINLPITGIKATGGSINAGYKWIDLQFITENKLQIFREVILKKFCFAHNGILTRINDDLANFNQDQLKQLEKCGVVTHPYTPHITLWYVDLPHENKIVELEYVAESLNHEIKDLTCYADSIALVELGRNGNALGIIDQYTLANNFFEL